MNKIETNVISIMLLGFAGLFTFLTLRIAEQLGNIGEVVVTLLTM